MIKKFECLDCHHHFDGDDSMDVTCPKCSSDNVRPAQGKALGYVVKAVVFIVVAALSAGTIKWIKGDNDNVVIVNPDPNPDDPKPDPDDPNPVPIPVPIPDPVYLKKEAVKSNADKGTYSLTVEAQNVPQGVKVDSYKLMSSDASRVILTNTDGRFQNIPPSSDGKYNVVCELSDGTEASLEGIEGFKEMKVVRQRLSAEELTKLLNAKDTKLNRGENDAVDRSASVIVLNPKDDDEKNMNNVRKIIEGIELMEISVKVTNLKYDSKGRVIEINLEIVN